MDVSLMTSEQFGKIIRNRKHWLIVFAGDGFYLIDDVDQELGTEPTFPTATLFSRFGFIAITIAPKSKMPRKKMLAAIAAVSNDPELVNNATPDQDIFIIADAEQAPSVIAAMRELAGVIQQC